MAISIDAPLRDAPARTGPARRRLGARLADRSVGGKLSLGFAAVSIVVLIVVCALLVAVARLSSANRNLAVVAATRVGAADEVAAAAGGLRNAQSIYLLDGGASRASFESKAHEFEQALDGLRRAVDLGDGVDRALIAKIGTGYQTFLETDALMWEEVHRGRRDVAINLALNAEALDFGFLADDARTIGERARRGAQLAQADFDRTARDARTLGMSLGGFCLLLVVILGQIITRAIRNPIAEVQRAAERAANGDLSVEIGSTASDETGRLARAFDSMLESLRAREQLLKVDHRRQELAGQVHRALEMADDEIAALDTITRTLTEIVPGCDAELLLADNSKAHLSQAAVAGPSATGPGCLVDSPFACAAVRNGTTMSFPSSDALDACPHLRDRAMGECSAVCVPVSFMGRAMGVFHTVGPPGQPASEDQAEALGMLATQAGARIGMLRSMVRTQIQASTDALTGLMNRRTMEARTRDLLREYRQYTLVMADLDHFKLLNDTHGHQAGDRALRAFAEVCRATARQGDLFARWGGEEFAFVCPDTHPTEALPIIDRVRLELSARVAASDIPRFTASFGLAWSGDHSTAEDIIHTADAALYRAKDAGRDRAVIGRPDLTGPHPDHIKVVPDGSAIAADSSPLGPIPFS